MHHSVLWALSLFAILYTYFVVVVMLPGGRIEYIICKEMAIYLALIGPNANGGARNERAAAKGWLWGFRCGDLGIFKAVYTVDNARSLSAWHVSKDSWRHAKTGDCEGDDLLSLRNEIHMFRDNILTSLQHAWKMLYILEYRGNNLANSTQ